MDKRDPKSIPHFIIVGCQKCGTTALGDLLGQHPEIHVPRGEASFFDKRFKLGVDFYHQFLTENAPPQVRLIGEKTPGYAIWPEAPERIKNVAPDAKLIWIFRDPVKRAYSHYWFSIQNGQDRVSFETAIELEPERGRLRTAWTYLSRGYYAEQIDRFLEFFPREQMLFLLFEHLKEDPASALSECVRFIGTETERFEFEVSRTNPTRLPRSVWIQWIAHEYFRKHAPIVYRAARRFNLRKSAGYPPMDDAMARRLYEHYAPHNQRLANLTGLDLSAWRRTPNS